MKHELFATPVWEDDVFISPSSADIMRDEVLDYAYKEIKDRTGNMINGTFVKDED